MEKELRINLTSIFDSKGIDKAKRSFSELERESLRTASSQRSISTASSDAARSVDTLSERVGFMGHAYVGFQAVVAGSSFMSDVTKSAINQADTWNLLEGRLRLVTDSSRQLASVQGSLFDISQESRTGYEQNADLYARIARATQDLNKTQYENLDVTEAISKSFIVSGAASESAKAAVIQLGQGFASGTLRGEELNSVLEQAPRLAEAIADGMGVSVGKLKEMGAEGKLTAEKVYEAIRTQKDAIEKEFDQMPKTVAQSLVVLQNQIGLSISEFDKMHGVTSSIASNITDLSGLLSEHSGEIGTYAGYVGEAVAAILIWKAGTIAMGVAQSAYTAYIAASTIATTSYSIATNMTTASVTTLTARQVAANVALSGWNKLVAINPYMIAGAAIIGVGLVLKNQADELRDSVKRTAIDVSNLSEKAIKAKITYATMQLGAVNDSIENPSIAKSLFGNVRIDLNRRAQLENEIKEYGKALQAFQDEANTPSKNTTPKPDPLSDKELKKIEALKEKQKRASEQLAKLNNDLDNEIFKSTASEYQKSMKLIDDSVTKYRDGGADKIKTAQLVSLKQEEYLDAEYAKAMGQFDSLDKESYEKSLKRIEQASSMYAAINEASGNWYDNEIVNISNRAAEFAAAGNDVIDIERYVSASMLSIDEKRAKEQADLAKKTFEEQNKFWIDLMGNIKNASAEQFFNAMKGDFTSFGSWLKDFWGAMTNSLARGLSKSLADAMIDTGAGGIQNIFKTFGGLGSVFGMSAIPEALLGATTDSAGFTTTAGGTVMDAAGQITKEGSDYANVVSAINAASTANTAYSVLTGGLASIGTNIATGFGYLAEGLNVAGLTSAGAAVSEFGLGAGSVFTGGSGFAGMSAMGAGQIFSGAAAGALGGYALGSLGDALFGADTRAGSYGAIGGGVGGAIGTVILPGVGTAIGSAIGATLGSLIGGMFGKTKQTGSGYYFSGMTNSENVFDTAQTYADFKKKSWFSSKSWTDFYALSDTEKSKVKGLFDTYDYLLGQLGSSDEIALSAGKYSGTSFQDQLAKNFISAFTDVESASTLATIYSYWADYAKSINQTISEAFASSIGLYLSETRTFTEWKLGSGTVEQLKFTADYLTKDLAALENQMGVSGITVDNYLSKYEEAMRSSFTPETITSWKNLGEALMAATDANNKYIDTLNKISSSAQRPADMMMYKVNDMGNDLSTVTNRLLFEMVRELKSIRTDNLFAGASA
ncbi:tape measure protein [Sulfuricurvum sp.]|uniref:tape measure protein n=1 Tax=Sulfuricurvum sp. TaxID=2025608 RepID=UPI002E304F7A|nr:tape measure protein [Sulfuricurvum sp.]HEX5330788.1 tape measure protein [Sulfuricurvum sp.]